MKKKPTIEFYNYLSEAFSFFNKALFDDELDHVMFVITRKKNVTGHFRRRGWLDENDEVFHEIAVNPQHFISASPLELYQTIVHEMTHQWQFQKGTESRAGYHNKEWADKMRSIGLNPISKNGKGTGQSVSDEPEPNGPFERACVDFFMKGHKLSIIDGAYSSSKALKQLNNVISDRVSKYDPSNEAQPSVLTSSLNTPMEDYFELKVPSEPKKAYVKKTTYQCPGCKAKAWGAPTLQLSCQACKNDMLIVS